MATVSYVRISTYTGTVLSGDGATWAPVTGVSFGATQTYATSAGGTGVGKAVLGDLSFALSQSTSLSPQLKQLLAQGAAVKVEVATYDPSTATTGSVGTLQSYDVFGNVAAGAGVAGLHTETLNGGVADVYTVTPGSFSQTTYGNGGQVSASAFDATTNRASNPAAAPTNVAAGTITPGTAPAQSGLSYYVQFKDASGNYVAGANGSTWLAVTGLSSELEQTLNINSQSSGAGAGKVAFDPTSFTLADTSVNPQLFLAEAKGTAYKDVQIEAVGANGQVVDSTTLGTVGIKQITQGQSPSIALEFGSYYTQHVSATGTVTGSGWDKIKNAVTSSTTADPIVQLKTGSAVAAQAATNFVSFKLYTGATLPGDLTGAAPGPDSALTAKFLSGTLFAATNVSFETEQTLNIGSQTTGAGAGKITFDALNITLAATPKSAVLDGYLFSGKPFATVSLGTASAGVTSELDSLKLVGVKADSLDLVAGTHSLQLEYGGLQEQTAAKATDGSITTSVPLGWNRVINVSDSSDAPLNSAGNPTTTSTTTGSATKTSSTSTTTSPSTTASNPNVSVLPAAAGSGAQTPAPTTNTAYVQFRDASGNVITGGANGASWFKLSSASTGFAQTLNIGTGSTGTGAGKATFDPLLLALGPDAVTAQLDKTLGTSGGITAEVASYSGNTLLNDYVFGGASLKTDAPSVTGSALSFDYTGFQETPYASGTAATPVTWSTATTPSASSAKVAAPTSAVPPTLRTPTQLVTYAEFVDASGNLIAGSNGRTLFATRNVESGPQATASGGPLSLSLGDDAVVSTLEAGLGSKATPVGVVLVSVDAANPRNVVSQQTYGDVYLSGDTLDNTGGDHRLTFLSAAGSGATYGSALAPAGYTVQFADDYRPDGTTGYSTAVGGALPSAALIKAGLPPGSVPIYQSFQSEGFSAGVSTADKTGNYSGLATNGLLSASNVKVDYLAKTGSFSVAASALPGLTQALAAGTPVAVTLQSVLGGFSGTTTTATFGGSKASLAALTGAALDPATGLAKVSFAFSAPPSITATVSGGSVKGETKYLDQLLVAPEPTGTADEVKFNLSFTNNLSPKSLLAATDLKIVDGSGSTVTGTIGLAKGATDGTYVATVTGLTGSGSFSIDGTDTFKASGVTNHPLSPALEAGSVGVATTTDASQAITSQSITVTTPDSPTTTTTFSSAGALTQTAVQDPDPSTSLLTTTYGTDGKRTSTTSVLTNGTTVVTTPGTADDPSGAGGTRTDTSQGNTLLYTVYRRADGTAAERVDLTGSAAVTTVYAADGTTPVSVTTIDPNGPTTVTLDDPKGVPLLTTVTNGDKSKTVTQYEAIGPYASVTTVYDATGKQIGQTEAARAPSVTLDGAGGPVTAPTVTVTGRIDIPGVTGTVQLAVNGTAAGSPVALNLDGTFAAVLPFAANGTYDVTATATTAVGGVGYTVAPVEYTVSDIAPTLAFTSVPVTSASAEQTITGLVTASGTAGVAGQAVTLTDNGVALATAAPVTVAQDGTFTADVVLPAEGANAIRASVLDSLGNAASASITETLDQVAPVVSSPTLTVAPGAGPTAVGIAPPSDDLTAPAALTIVVGGLPADGTLTLADGATPVTAGMNLSIAQLGGLLFTPTAGLFDQSAAFTYTVTDGAGNGSTGRATLAIADATAEPSPPAIPVSPSAPPVSPSALPVPPPATADAPPGTAVSPPATASALPSAAPSATLPAPITTANDDGSTTTVTFNADGSSVVQTSGGSRFDGKRYSAVTDTYAADGTRLSERRAGRDGTSSLIADAPGQIFDVSDVTFIYNQHRARTTFVFEPGSALGVVDGFVAKGARHDTISLSSADFGDGLADVLRNTIDTAGGAVIFDPVTNDIVRLVGVTTADLKMHPKIVEFHA